jgi:hypothetical protein
MSAPSIEGIGSATTCPGCGCILRTWTGRNFTGMETEHNASHGDNNLCEACDGRVATNMKEYDAERAARKAAGICVCLGYPHDHDCPDPQE